MEEELALKLQGCGLLWAGQVCWDACSFASSRTKSYEQSLENWPPPRGREIVSEKRKNTGMEKKVVVKDCLCRNYPADPKFWLQGCFWRKTQHFGRPVPPEEMLPLPVLVELS